MRETAFEDTAEGCASTTMRSDVGRKVAEEGRAAARKSAERVRGEPQSGAALQTAEKSRGVPQCDAVPCPAGGAARKTHKDATAWGGQGGPKNGPAPKPVEKVREAAESSSAPEPANRTSQGPQGGVPAIGRAQSNRE